MALLRLNVWACALLAVVAVVAGCASPGARVSPPAARPQPVARVIPPPPLPPGSTNEPLVFLAEAADQPARELAAAVVAPPATNGVTMHDLYVYDDPDLGRFLFIHVDGVQADHRYRLQSSPDRIHWHDTQQTIGLNDDYVFEVRMLPPPPNNPAGGAVANQQFFRIHDETGP